MDHLLILIPDLLLLISGVVCLYASITSDHFSRTARASGRVVAHEYEDGHRHDRIAFRAEGADSEIEFVEGIRGLRKREPGMETRVRYNPVIPQDAQVDDPIHRVRLVGLLLLGLTLTVGAVARLEARWLVAAMGLGIWGYAVLLIQHRFFRTRVASGKVIALETKLGRENARVAFISDDGTEHEISQYGLRHLGMKVGDTALVRFPRNRPDQAKIEDHRFYHRKLILLTAGTPLISMGLFEPSQDALLWVINRVF